jgi:hypothetical protein
MRTPEYTAKALVDLRSALDNAKANKLETGPDFEGSHNCLDNIIRDYDRRNGGFWFSPDSMRFFGTKFPDGFHDVPAARVTLFLTTESPPHDGRKASVRAYLWDTASIATPGPFAVASLAAARATLAKLVDALNGPVLRVSWSKPGTCEAGEFLTRWPDEADAFQAEKTAAGCEVERDTLNA